MYYSETKVIMGGLAHVPILIFIVNFIKGKFESIALKVLEVKTEKPMVKVVEVKEEEESGRVKRKWSQRRKRITRKKRKKRGFYPFKFRSIVNVNFPNSFY